MAQTTEIINEFVELIDTNKDYTLKDLKQILTEVYNTKAGKNKKKADKPIKTTNVVPDTDSSDDEKPKKRGRPAKVKLDKNGDIKVKKAPSAYNIYVKQTIEAMKKENPATPAKELMGLAANKWKSLTQEEKDTYKVQV
jgi:hypothetical protein